MLSKQTFLPTKSLFIAAGIAACGLAAAQQSANALNISTTLGPTDYIYSISTEAGEGLASGGTISFSSLVDVTSVTAPSGFTASAPGSTVTFTATQNYGDLFNSVPLGDFTIISTATPGAVSFATTANGANTPASLGGPVVSASASVPFEFSPGLGLFLSGTIFGALKLRGKFSSKEEINL